MQERYVVIPKLIPIYVTQYRESANKYIEFEITRQQELAMDTMVKLEEIVEEQSGIGNSSESQEKINDIDKIN